MVGHDGGSQNFERTFKKRVRIGEEKRKRGDKEKKRAESRRYTQSSAFSLLSLPGEPASTAESEKRRDNGGRVFKKKEERKRGRGKTMRKRISPSFVSPVADGERK